MPVFIFEPDAFDKMCQVEGEGYAENQKTFRTCSFGAFKTHWERLVRRSPNIKEDGGDMRMSMNDGMSTIYGYHGWNRYGVCYSGEIVFIEAFAAPKEAIKFAKEVGFRIK